MITLAPAATAPKSASNTRQDDNQDIQKANASQITKEVKEEDDKRSTPVTFNDGLDVHSDYILDFMDEIIPNCSSLTDDDLNETIIPSKSTKTDLSQLEFEDIQTANASPISTEVKEGDNKHSTPLKSSTSWMRSYRTCPAYLTLTGDDLNVTIISAISMKGGLSQLEFEDSQMTNAF